MAKKKSLENEPLARPATSPKDQEDELINLAVKLAEKQLKDGTASTQVIVHYLKLGSTRGMLEQEMLENKTKLVKAQTESIQAAQKNEELYKNALKAMSIYTGAGAQEEEE